MLPKEIETMSAPVISFSKHRILENDMENVIGRERGHSFQDIMKNNVPSVARNPSPKPHRKHHHHHHRHNSRSPSTSRKENRLHRSSIPESNLLRANKDDSFRLRSYSDTQLSMKSSIDTFLKTAVTSSPLLMRPLYSRQKSSLDESETSTDDDDDNGGIVIVVENHDDSNKDLTITREIIGDKDEVTQSDKETITRRKDEVFVEVKRNSKKLRKVRTLQMIDQLLEQCTENYRTIEFDIESEFTRLHLALETRKKELLENAKNIRDSKMESLKESKKKCLSSKSVLRLKKSSSFSSSFDTESGSGTGNSSRRDSGEHDVCLQSNGILEPWKASKKEDNNVDMEIVVKKLDESEEIFSDILEEGNMSFKFNEESIEMFSSLGQINRNLSSPQFSFVKGLQHGIALAGESVRFEVHTQSVNNELSYNVKDDIKCQIFNFDGEAVEITNKLSLQRCLSNGRVVVPNSPLTPLHKFYSYVFTPQELGKYNIRISINNVEIKSSPFLFTVYPKVDLTFDLNSPEEKKEMAALNGVCTLVERRKLTMKRRQSSEEGDWVEDNWIVQKGDKSSLLRCITEVPSYIYAAPSVKGFCAWKLRVTCACESVNLSVGLGTRSGIPDIDEHFSCDFAITPSTDSRKNSGSRIHVRRTSSFTRISVTYNVLVSTEEGVVRVICEQNDDDKTVKINPKLKDRFELFPFVSMVHRHDECGRQVCPRPQITLL